MIKFIYTLFGIKIPKTDFSEFFVGASDKEKEDLMRDVVRKANEDQRDLVKKYQETYEKSR